MSLVKILMSMEQLQNSLILTRTLLKHMKIWGMIL